jgi:hypothetical protein
MTITIHVPHFALWEWCLIVVAVSIAVGVGKSLAEKAYDGIKRIGKSR